MPQIEFFLKGIQEVKEDEMKFEIMANFYGSRAGEKSLKDVLSSLDTVKIENRFKDEFDEEG